MDHEITLALALPEHIPLLALRMRPPDRAEVLASGGFNAADAIRSSLAVSEFARVAFIDGELAAMFGVAPARAGPWHVPWLLTTDVVDRFPFLFYKASKIVLRELREAYPDLVQAIDARHPGALSWLKRLGFQVGEPQTFGRAALTFYPVRIGG